MELDFGDERGEGLAQAIMLIISIPCSLCGRKAWACHETGADSAGIVGAECSGGFTSSGRLQAMIPRAMA